MRNQERLGGNAFTECVVSGRTVDKQASISDHLRNEEEDRLAILTEFATTHSAEYFSPLWKGWN